MIFKRFIPLILSFIFYLNSFSQNNSRHLTGVVTDENKNPLMGANVALTDSLTGQFKIMTQTDKSGKFDLVYSFSASSYLSVRYLGCKTYLSNVILPGQEQIGNIILSSEGRNLNSVNIVSKKPLITAKDGGITVNVQESINSEGSTLYEVLQKSPGVSINQNNEITLNGKGGVRVFLNGKMVYMEAGDLAALLKSMPSSGVKSIDLITNPSAKYDAAGGAGIIDIKTKKIDGYGLNGSVTTALAYGYSFKQNSELDLNYRNNKLNLYGSYNHLLGDFGATYHLDRKIGGDQYLSKTEDTDKRARMNSNIGADYQISNSQVIGILLSGNLLYGPGVTHTTTQVTPEGYTVVQQVLNASNNYYQQNNNKYNSSLNYKWQDTLGQSLSIDADYGYFDGGSKNYQPNVYTDFAKGNILSSQIYRSLNATSINLYAFKADYENKLFRGTISAGAKISSVNSNNDYRFYNVVPGESEIEDLNRSNAFKYKERIASGYVNYSYPLGAFKLVGGLRAENTNSDGILNFRSVSSGESAGEVNHRNYLNLFPSAAVSYTVDPKNNFTVSYSRRIDRPSYQDLNPFVYLLDELSFWQGNPFLKPQYTDKYAINYAYGQSTFLTFGYAHTNNFFAEISNTIDASHIVMTPVNGGVQNHFSLTLTQSFAPLSWWNIDASGIVYHIRNNLSLNNDTYQQNLNATAYNLNVVQTFKMPYLITGELSGNYNSNTLSGINNRSKANGSVDFGMQKKIIRGDGTVRISVSDIFLTTGWNNTSILNDLQVNSYGRGESRRVRLSFTYRFGSKKIKEHRDQGSALEAEKDRIKTQ